MFPKETKVLSCLKPALKSKIKKPSNWWNGKVNFSIRNASQNNQKRYIRKKHQLIGCFFLQVWCWPKHREVKCHS